MADSAPRKPSTKAKVAAKKASAAKKAASEARPAARRRPVSRHAAALPVVETLTNELELERPSTPKAEARTVPSAHVTSEPMSAPSRGHIPNRDITVFLRQLIMMFEAGTPILKALKSLARRGENKGVRALVGGIAEYVEAGNPLWQAFAREGRNFSPVEVNLIKAAEASGSLPAVLKRIAEYREQRERLKRQMIVAMIYPVIVTVVAFVLVVVLSMFVLPAFQDMFDELGVKLNGYTRFVMGTANFVSHTWWIFVVVVVGLILAYRLWWVRSPVRQLQADRLKLRLPLFGGLARRRVTTEFMRTFSMLLRSGVSMMATLDLCKNSVGNRAYIGVIQDMRDSIESGEGLEAPLRKAEKDKYFDGVVVDMLLTGEESGGLEQVADQIAKSYEEEIDVTVKGISEAILPVFVVLMAFIVGSIVIGLFLPLIAMIESISSGQGM
jgi:type IV pilus assembly protein PilC